MDIHLPIILYCGMRIVYFIRLYPFFCEHAYPYWLSCLYKELFLKKQY